MPVPSTAEALPVHPADACPSCGASRTGRFCSGCGEKRLEPEHDHSLRWLLGEVAQGWLSFDSRLLRTFGALLFAPGRLTRAFFEGRRVPYLTPLQVFLLTSVLFYCCFDKAYVAPIDSLQSSYERGVWLGNLLHFDIGALLDGKARAAHESVDLLRARVFERASQQSKVFLGALMPGLGVAMYVLFRRHRAGFVPHLVAAVHAFSLFLLLDLGFLGVCRLFGMQQISDWNFLPLLLAYTAHLFGAVRHIHAIGRFEAAWKTALLVATLVASILVFRQVVTIVVAVAA